MGLLSTILTVGGTAIGAAVGGPMGAQIGGSLGAAVGGAADQSKGAKGAVKATERAEAAARAERRAAADKVGGLQAPYVQGGYEGWNALGSRFGLPTQGAGGVASAPVPQPAGNSDRGYMPNAPGVPTYDPAMDDFGGGAPGTMSAGGAGGGAPIAQQPGGGNALAPGGTYGNAQNPTYLAPTPYQAPEIDRPTYQDTYQDRSFDKTYTAPTFDKTYDPGKFDFSVDEFVNNPAFKFAMEQGSGQVMANAAATGARQSGSALKALQDRGQKTAYGFYAPERDAAYARYSGDRTYGYNALRDQRGDFESDRSFGYTDYRDQRGDYENDRDFDRTRSRDGRTDFNTDRTFNDTAQRDDRDFGYGQSIDDRNFGRKTFESDRTNYNDRFDRQTDDLFKYSDMGQRAAGVVGNAELGYGIDAAGSQRTTGEARAGNALAQGNISSGLAGDIAGLTSSYLTAKKGNALKTAVTEGAAANPYLF